MEAVHFGAGNIGRGFIGLLLHQAGYSVTFVDVNDEVIKALKERRSYTVHVASDEQSSYEVNAVNGLNSKTEEKKVFEAIRSADIITTAVGPAALPMIAPIIAKGIKGRTDGKLVNIIACENAIRATSTLRNEVFQYLSDDEKLELEGVVGFADAAVDRIVPSVASEDVLEVTVEPFYEWIVEKSGLIGDHVQLGKAMFVDDLDAYLARKLFTVNTGHAVAAYAGYRAGKKSVLDALADRRIEAHVRGALKETSNLLVNDYGFEAGMQAMYMEKIIERYKNPYLQDTVSRVGRGPIRKLGANERLVKPAKALCEKGENPEYLIGTIINVLHFHAENDAESEKMKNMINDKGMYETFRSISGLDEKHPLAIAVKERLQD